MDVYDIARVTPSAEMQWSIETLIAPEPWVQDALCGQTDPEAFFPPKGSAATDAKKVCARCDVRAECLDYALRTNQRYGIYGGLSERERRKLRKGGTHDRR